MTIEEAQTNFVKILKEKGINVSRESLFFDNKSKRLTSTGNIYASMLKISEETKKYTLHEPLSQETKKILENSLSSFYYVELANNSHSVAIGYRNPDDENAINITVYENNFDIKIQLLGGIDEWWKKVKGEYYA